MTPTYGPGGSVFSSPPSSTFTFTSCGDQTLNLTPQNTGEATFNFAVARFNTNSAEVEADDFNVTGMTFKLIVVDPQPEILDADGDGVADDADNCPSVSNADQADADGDQLGKPVRCQLLRPELNVPGLGRDGGRGQHPGHLR